MEEVAQGRVWTGNDAASRGLVDAIGGLSRAVAIAKQKASIPQDRQVGSLLINLFKLSISKQSIMSFIYFWRISRPNVILLIHYVPLSGNTEVVNASFYLPASGVPVAFKCSI